MNVYCITFPNGKRYVGVESRTGRRKYVHKKSQTNNVVHKAIRKYGWSNCVFEYLVMDKTPSECWAMEKRLIAEWRLQDRGFGYNVSAGGECTRLGVKNSIVHNKKISDANLGHSVSEACRTAISLANSGKNNGMYGKISFWRGKHLPLETRQKLSNAMRGRRPWNKGISRV